MNVQRTFNRRTLLLGTVALGSVGLLAACGGSKDDKLSGKAASSAEDVVKNLQINKQDYSSLKKGGELKLSVSALGPDFNTMTQSGYTTENLAAFGGPCNTPAVVGFYNTDPAGERSINKDFCLEHKMETKDGVQTVEFKINPKAVFNDGTPIDVEAVKAYWEIYKGGGDSGYNIIPNPSWEQMESIEAVDGDKFHVKITLSTPYYLSDDLGTFATHPALVDKKLFNDGFVDKPMDQYWAGPFKVSNWNSSEKVITLAPNDKWWGEKKPLLEKIIWRQMGIDSLRAAFKNGELDAAGFTDAATYSAVKGQNGTEIRSGQNTGVQNLQFNATRVTDLAVRRAAFAAVDRSQLADVAFKQVGWEEPMPGSMLAMPFQKGYEDNVPKDSGADAAKKILEEAGYTKSGDFYQKDGKTAGFSITTFGSDTVTQAKFQRIEQQLKQAGIKVTNDNQPESNFNSVVGTKSYDCTLSGWAVGANMADSPQYFYTKDINNGVGDDEIDKLIAKISATESKDEQIKLANQVEKLHMEKVAIYLPFANGPSYSAVKSKLANYGPRLFQTSYTDANLWVNVGWQE